MYIIIIIIIKTQTSNFPKVVSQRTESMVEIIISILLEI